MLIFDWDPNNLRHIAEHGVSAEETEQVVQNDPIELPGDVRNGEFRQPLLGETDDGRILIVIVTEVNEAIRIITAWPAKERLRKFWLTLTKGQAHGGEIKDS